MILSKKGLMSLLAAIANDIFPHMLTKGSLKLARKQKRHRFQMGSERIQFNVYIEQRQRSKRKFAFEFVFTRWK